MRAGLKHKKAKRMTAEGAYRKATTSLTSDMMQFSAEEDIKYAKELLPTSSSPSAALAPRPAADTAGAPTAPHGDAIPDPAENSPLKVSATLRSPRPAPQEPDPNIYGTCSPSRADVMPTGCCRRSLKSTRPWLNDACQTRRGG